jgi:hypothetical protein
MQKCDKYVGQLGYYTGATLVASNFFTNKTNSETQTLAWFLFVQTLKSESIENFVLN